MRSCLPGLLPQFAVPQSISMHLDSHWLTPDNGASITGSALPGLFLPSYFASLSPSKLLQHVRQI
jgi:hypothetical protein